MNRRKFLSALILVAVSPKIEALTEVPWVHTPTEAERLAALSLYFDARLFGIPYHQSNASTGQWLGISRADFVWDKKEI